MKCLDCFVLIVNIGKVVFVGVVDWYVVDIGFIGVGIYEIIIDLVLQIYDLFNFFIDILLLYQVGKFWYWIQVECVYVEIKGNVFVGVIMLCVEVILFVI